MKGPCFVAGVLALGALHSVSAQTGGCDSVASAFVAPFALTFSESAVTIDYGTDHPPGVQDNESIEFQTVTSDQCNRPSRGSNNCGSFTAPSAAITGYQNNNPNDLDLVNLMLQEAFGDDMYMTWEVTPGQAYYANFYWADGFSTYGDNRFFNCSIYEDVYGACTMLENVVENFNIQSTYGRYVIGLHTVSFTPSTPLVNLFCHKTDNSTTEAKLNAYMVVENNDPTSSTTAPSSTATVAPTSTAATTATTTALPTLTADPTTITNPTLTMNPTPTMNTPTMNPTPTMTTLTMNPTPTMNTPTMNPTPTMSTGYPTSGYPTSTSYPTPTNVFDISSLVKCNSKTVAMAKRRGYLSCGTVEDDASSLYVRRTSGGSAYGLDVFLCAALASSLEIDYKISSESRDPTNSLLMGQVDVAFAAKNYATVPLVKFSKPYFYDSQLLFFSSSVESGMPFYVVNGFFSTPELQIMGYDVEVINVFDIVELLSYIQNATSEGISFGYSVSYYEDLSLQDASSDYASIRSGFSFETDSKPYRIPGYARHPKGIAVRPDDACLSDMTNAFLDAVFSEDAFIGNFTYTQMAYDAYYGSVCPYVFPGSFNPMMGLQQETPFGGYITGMVDLLERLTKNNGALDRPALIRWPNKSFYKGYGLMFPATAEYDIESDV